MQRIVCHLALRGAPHCCSTQAAEVVCPGALDVAHAPRASTCAPLSRRPGYQRVAWTPVRVPPRRDSTRRGFLGASPSLDAVAHPRKQWRWRHQWLALPIPHLSSAFGAATAREHAHVHALEPPLAPGLAIGVASSLLVLMTWLHIHRVERGDPRASVCVLGAQRERPALPPLLDTPARQLDTPLAVPTHVNGPLAASACEQRGLRGQRA